MRLGLEQFEAREVPAALTWTNSAGNNDFYTASNWVVTGTSTISAAAPMAGDDVTFNGGVSSANYNNLGVLQLPTGGGGTNAVGPMSFASTLTTTPTGLNSLNLINGYAGTVSVVAPLETATFVLSAAATGAISQPISAAGNDITVTQTFTWTRGKLNSSTNAAMLKLLGATATINPGVGNRISSGDTIVLDSGAHATFYAGEVDLTGGTGIEVNASCQMDVKTIPEGAAILKSIDIKIYIKLKVDSLLAVVVVEGNTVGYWNAYDLKIQNDGGDLQFQKGTLSDVGPAEVAAQAEAFITQTAGKMLISAGAQVSSRPNKNRFTQVSGGEVLIVDEATTGAIVPATLIGNLTLSGGSIKYGGRYTEFRVDGYVTWSGGVLSTRLDVSQNGVTDLWSITGKLTIPNNSTAQIQPSTAGWDPQLGVAANFGGVRRSLH